MFALFSSGSKAPPAPSWAHVVISTLGATAAIGLTGWLSVSTGAVWLMAPFGASCVLGFGMPDSPLAQPRHIVGGHCVATLVGLVVLHTLGDAWWAGAIAVGIALAAMQLTRTVHPPAGADPLVVISAHVAPSFLLYPVLAGSIIIVAIAWFVNVHWQRKRWPIYWW